MKMKYIVYMALGFVLSLAACKNEEIQLNIPEGTIYMNKKSLSIEENFANYPESINEVIVDLLINVTGAPQDYDRVYQWVAQDSSTAVLGRDYEFVSDRLVVKAGALVDTAQVRLKRDNSLGDEKLFLYLKLVPGKDFLNEIKGFDVISTVSLYDKVNEPPYWYWFAYDYLGDYSEKKFRLLQDIAGMPVDALDNEPESDREFNMLLGKLKRWGIILKRHLDEQMALGTPVLEDDNDPESIMQVGEFIN